jgi:hypothetical protein
MEVKEMTTEYFKKTGNFILTYVLIQLFSMLLLSLLDLLLRTNLSGYHILVTAVIFAIYFLSCKGTSLLKQKINASIFAVFIAVPVLSLIVSILVSKAFGIEAGGIVAFFLTYFNFFMNLLFIGLLITEIKGVSKLIAGTITIVFAALFATAAGINGLQTYARYFGDSYFLIMYLYIGLKLKMHDNPRTLMN